MQESADSFFIPRRKQEANKARSIPHGGSVTIEKKVVVTAAAVAIATTEGDIEFVYAESREAFEKKKENALVSAVWAIEMYMEPVNVMHTCIYWLSQYANYKIPEAQWFNDLIDGLMYQPVRFSLCASQGFAHTESKHSKYTLLMHTAGTTLHKIPDEYFIQRDCIQVMECLAHFLVPTNKCFLTTNTFELKGEVELATFQYNRVLSYFYEPSFLILTAYMLYVHYLYSLAPREANSSSFLPHIKNIMKPITHEHIQWDALLSLDVKNSNYTEKRCVFEQDLVELSHALQHIEMAQIKDNLATLWAKKATYLTDLIPQRFESIYNQLYPPNVI